MKQLCVSNSHPQTERSSAGHIASQRDRYTERFVLLKTSISKNLNSPFCSFVENGSTVPYDLKPHFYLLGIVLRTLKNLAPTWPLFLWILLDISAITPPSSLHPALISFLSLPQMLYAFLHSHASMGANASTWIVLPILPQTSTCASNPVQMSPFQWIPPSFVIS